MKNSNVVIFDVYNTLIENNKDEDSLKAYECFARWLAFHGIRIHPKVVRDRFKLLARKGIEANTQPYPDIDIGEVFKQIFAEVEGKRAKLKGDSFIEEAALQFRLCTTKSLSLYPGTLALLESLKKKVRLAIISNSQRLFTIPELASFDLVKYFEYILISSDIKTGKPNPKIFRRALRDLKVNPGQAVYVGDNLFDDVWGAQNAGIKTVRILHKRHVALPKAFPKNIKKPIPDHEVPVSRYRGLPEKILSMFKQ